VSGVDIVKEQISIAAGRKLRYQQSDISPKGWAIECRITAEDPFNNFLPSAGMVTYLKEPTGPGVRVESALYRGAEISLYYDPMVAKLVVYGESRAEAILRMKRALAEYRIGGIKTSIPFHQHIMDSTEFIWGTFDTGFLNRRTLRKQEQAHEESERAAAVAAALIAHEEKRKAAVLVGAEAGSNGAQGSNGSGGSLWKSVGRLRSTRGRL
jgi:acetyl/propionyl-CoA carboxylase alpha subunit